MYFYTCNVCKEKYNFTEFSNMHNISTQFLNIFWDSKIPVNPLDILNHSSKEL